MQANIWKELRTVILKHCKRGNFALSSGKKSDFYIDMRNPLGFGALPLSEFGQEIAKFMESMEANVIAGPAAGAIPLMTAALLSYEGRVINFGNEEKPDFRALKMVYTCSSRKEHGLSQKIEGPSLRGGDRIILVDDVLTSGNSLLQCANTLTEFDFDTGLLPPSNLKIVGVWVCVDREEGGREMLKQNIPSLHAVTAAYKKSDLLPHLS